MSDLMFKTLFGMISCICIVGIILMMVFDVESGRKEADKPIPLETQVYMTEKGTTVQVFEIPSVAQCIATHKSMQCNWKDHE